MVHKLDVSIVKKYVNKMEPYVKGFLTLVTLEGKSF